MFRLLIGRLTSVAVIAPTGIAAAERGARTDTTTDGAFGGTAWVNGVHYSVGGRSGPKCSWQRWTQGQYEDFFNLRDLGVDDPPEPLDPDVEYSPEEIESHESAVADWERYFAQENHRRSQPSSSPVTQNGEVLAHAVFTMHCPDGAADFRFVTLSTDAAELLPGAFAAAAGQVPPPLPEVSPPAANGGWVNLGMWLAIEPQAVESVTAEAGPNAWVTVTPTHEGMVFDFGNGDSLRCAGFGIRIESVHPDLDTTEESPVCGYTYRRSSPDDAPYQLVVGSTWALSYASSDGSGDLDDVTRTVTQGYDVDELQTVGVQN